MGFSFISGWRADALVLLAALIWGVAFYFQKSAMAQLGPLTFLGLRAVIATLALAPLAWRETPAPKVDAKGSLAGFVLLGGTAFFAGGAVQQIGIVDATVTNAGFLTALYVVVTPFVVWVLKRKAPAWSVWFGAAMAFTGAWLMSGGSLHAMSRGDLLIMASSVLWSLFIFVTGESGGLGRPFAYTCLQFAVVAVLSLAGALAFETISAEAIAAAALPVLFVGLLSSAVTFALLSVAMRHVPAARASILVSTETLFAALAGTVMLNERLSPQGWIGAGLMIVAILVVQLAPRKDG